MSVAPFLQDAARRLPRIALPLAVAWPATLACFAGLLAWIAAGGVVMFVSYQRLVRYTVIGLVPTGRRRARPGVQPHE